MKSTLRTIGRPMAVVVALAACNGAPLESADPPGRVSLAPRDYQWTTADGERMPYAVTGEGEVAVVLIHCWMCDRSFWSEQVPVLAEHYRTIAVDLPGHGEASAGREVWSLAGYGDDVAGLIDALDLTGVVLVGHSMGGPVSLRAAALLGDRVRGIVAVDTLHDADFDFSGEEVESFLAAFESDFAGACGRFVQAMFTEDGVDEIMNTVRETSCREQRAAIGMALMRNFGDIDMPRWLADAGVPIVAINAAAPNPTRLETNRRYADFDVVLMEDVGHYLQMTRPERFNPLLLEAIAGLLRDGP
jgi:pimeloyl-ACP methyl ester carboxylesterase